MPCKIVVNTDSGNAKNIKLNRLLGLFDNADVENIDRNSDWTSDGYDTVVVCGGDGTLKNALSKCNNKKLYFAPCGTLNETTRFGNEITTVGKCNDELFSYVCAAGSFTATGYTATPERKRRFKAFAYLPQVLKSYVCHNIAAQIDADGKHFCGKYTLLMAIKSQRCFGFDFNKMYKKKPQLYLLAIKSCGKDGLLSRIRMFFPFFRVFFCGVRKPTINKKWMMIPICKAKITLSEPQDFCLDGEKRRLSQTLEFAEKRLAQRVEVIDCR